MLLAVLFGFSLFTSAMGSWDETLSVEATVTPTQQTVPLPDSVVHSVYQQ